MKIKLYAIVIICLFFNKLLLAENPTVIIRDAIRQEGTSGEVKQMSFVVTLNGEVHGGFRLDYSTENNEATNMSYDYSNGSRVKVVGDYDAVQDGINSLTAGTWDMKNEIFYFIAGTSSKLYRYELATDKRSEIQLPIARRYGDLAFGPDGKIHGSSTWDWWTLNPDDPDSWTQVYRDMRPDMNCKIGFGVDGTLYGQANQADIFGIVDKQTGQFERIIAKERIVRMGEISNAGINKKVVEVIYGAGTPSQDLSEDYNLYEIEVKTGKTNMVSASIPGHHIDGIEWNPYKKLLYYASYVDGAYHIYQWDPETDTHTRIVENLNTIGSVYFQGKSGENQKIDILIRGDDQKEPEERFLVKLAGIHPNRGGEVEIDHPYAIGTILDDDSEMLPEKHKLGEVLFFDNFEDGKAYGWQEIRGDWSVVEENGNKVYRQKFSGSEENMLTIAGDSSWRNYRLQFKMKLNELGPKGGGCATGGVRVKDEGKRYYFIFSPTAYNGGAVELKKRVDQQNLHNWSLLALQKQYKVEKGIWYKIRMDIQDNVLSFYVNGRKELETKVENELPSGRIHLGTWWADVSFDDVLVLGL